MLAALFLILLSQPAFANQAFDAYSSSVLGTARQVALGGAALADPKDYSAVFANPAGLSGLATSGLDFGSDASSIQNSVVNLDNPSARTLNAPLSYNFYGVRYVRDKSWGIGFTVETPFSEDDLFNAQTRQRIGGKTVVITTADMDELKAKVTTYSLGFGKSFLDHRLGLGATLNYHQMDQSFQFTPVKTTSAPYSNSATHSTFSGDLGLLAQPWPWLRATLVYKMGYGTAFGESLQPQMTAFPDVKSPDHLDMGVAWLPNRMFRLFAASHLVFGMNNTVILGSGLFPSSSGRILAGRYTTIDGHWGCEFIPIDEPDLTIRLWGGGYLEETGAEGDFERYHRTAGLAFEPWFFNVNVAADDAPMFFNFTAGVGVDVLQLARYTAKAFGKDISL